MIPKTIQYSHKQKNYGLQPTVESARIIPNSLEALKHRNLTLKQ